MGWTVSWERDKNICNVQTMPHMESAGTLSQALGLLTLKRGTERGWEKTPWIGT